MTKCPIFNYTFDLLSSIKYLQNEHISWSCANLTAIVVQLTSTSRVVAHWAHTQHWRRECSI